MATSFDFQPTSTLTKAAMLVPFAGLLVTIYTTAISKVSGTDQTIHDIGLAILKTPGYELCDSAKAALKDNYRLQAEIVTEVDWQYTWSGINIGLCLIITAVALACIGNAIAAGGFGALGWFTWMGVAFFLSRDVENNKRDIEWRNGVLIPTP